MIKKVGILTFHASHNYGSMLQAWALQTYLKGIGIEAEEINLRIDAQKDLYPNPMRFWGPKSILFRIKHPIRELQGLTKWYKFESFLKKHIDTTLTEYHSWLEIQKDMPSLNYDAIICGGDQIWNTTCVDFSESYYLPGNLLGIKKIAYSPSFGGKMSRFNNPEVQKFIKDNLSAFDFLSVRDDAGSIFLSDLLGKQVPAVADPTLLISVKDYTKIFCRNNTPKGDYIFYYSPFYNKNAEAIAANLGKRMRIPVITTNGELQSNSYFIQMNSAGPIEFINYLKNAKFVCGYSYHLVVFSLLFHKDFAAIDGKKDARIMGLLKHCNLERKASNDVEEIISNLGGLDEDIIDKCLQNERQTGIDYLNKVFGTSIPHTSRGAVDHT